MCVENYAKKWLYYSIGLTTDLKATSEYQPPVSNKTTIFLNRYIGLKKLFILIMPMPKFCVGVVYFIKCFKTKISIFINNFYLWTSTTCLRQPQCWGLKTYYLLYNNLVIAINGLMLAVAICPKVITISGFLCNSSQR